MDLIISDDSPLRCLPANLNREQTAYIDGIRVLIEMIGLAYGRLAANLVAIATGDTLSSALNAVAFQDAWAIVDSVHRLRKLLCQMPRMNQSTPKFKLFSRKTAPAVALRNRFQHLAEEIRKTIGGR
jgi:hypothetical protein